MLSLACARQMRNYGQYNQALYDYQVREVLINCAALCTAVAELLGPQTPQVLYSFFQGLGVAWPASTMSAHAGEFFPSRPPGKWHPPGIWAFEPQQQGNYIEELVEVPVSKQQQRQVEVIVDAPVSTTDEEHAPVLRQVNKHLKQQQEGEDSVVDYAPITKEGIVQVPKIIFQEMVDDQVEQLVEGIAHVPVINHVERIVPNIQIEEAMFQKHALVQKVVQKAAEVPQTQIVDEFCDVPVIKQRLVPMIIKQQKTVEVTQIEYSDHHVQVPVMKQRLVPIVTVVQKIVEVPQIEYVDEYVQVPVQKQVQVPIGTVVDLPVRKQVCVPMVTAVDVPVHKQVHVPMVTVVDVPVQKIVHVPMVTVVKKTVEVPQIEYIDHHVHVPVKKQRQETIVSVVQKIVEVPKKEYVDEFVQVPVQKQVHVPIVTVADVPVHKQVYDTMDVVADVPVHRQVHGPKVTVVDVPVQKIVRVPNGTVFQKTVEGPQIKYVDHHEQVPLHKQRHGPMVSVAQKTVEEPQIQALDKYVEDPVQQQMHLPTFLEPTALSNVPNKKGTPNESSCNDEDITCKVREQWQLARFLVVSIEILRLFFTVFHFFWQGAQALNALAGTIASSLQLFCAQCWSLAKWTVKCCSALSVISWRCFFWLGSQVWHFSLGNFFTFFDKKVEAREYLNSAELVHKLKAAREQMKQYEPVERQQDPGRKKKKRA